MSALTPRRCGWVARVATMLVVASILASGVAHAGATNLGQCTGNNRTLWTRVTRGPASHAAAKADCLGLALEGVTGWHLPSAYAEVPQYMTGGLQGCPVCNPAIDQAAFPDTPVGSNGYWTSEYDGVKGGYSVVNFCDGRNNYFEDPATMLPYRCDHDPL